METQDVTLKSNQRIGNQRGPKRTLVAKRVRNAGNRLRWLRKESEMAKGGRERENARAFKGKFTIGL
jgi:hypothetical protein